MSVVNLIVFIFINISYILNGQPVTNYLETFERSNNGILSNWSLNSWGSPGASIEIVSNISHSGNKCLKIVFNPTNKWRSAGGLFDFVTNTIDYRNYNYLIFYLRGEPANTGTFDIYLYDDDNATIDSPGTKYNNNDQLIFDIGEVSYNYWKKIMVPLDVNKFSDDNPGHGDDTASLAKVEGMNFFIVATTTNGASGNIFIDDIFLVKDDSYMPVQVSGGGSSGNDIIEFKDFNPMVKKNSIMNYKIIVKNTCQIEWKILSLSGKILYSDIISSVNSGTEASISISDIDFVDGVYFLVINAYAGDTSTRIIKKIWILE